MNKCQEALEKITVISELKQLEGSFVKYVFDKQIGILKELELISNEPLKFEQIKPNMWIWDNKDKKYIEVEKTEFYRGIYSGEQDSNIIFYKDPNAVYVKTGLLYCPTRFYRYQPLEN